MPVPMTRGERNNNPLNLDFHLSNDWQGQLGIEDIPENGTQPRFAKFDSPENGIRAAAKILLKYQSKHACSTVRMLVNRWAPPSENSTGAYVNTVAAAMQVDPDIPIDLSDFNTLKSMVMAMIRVENGRDIFADNVIEEGIKRALGAEPPPIAA